MVPFWVPIIIRGLIRGLVYGTQKGTIILTTPRINPKPCSGSRAWVWSQDFLRLFFEFIDLSVLDLLFRFQGLGD